MRELELGAHGGGRIEQCATRDVSGLQEAFSSRRAPESRAIRHPGLGFMLGGCACTARSPLGVGAQANVETAKRAMGALNQSRLMVGGGDPLPTLREFCDPDVEWDSRDEASIPRFIIGESERSLRGCCSCSTLIVPLGAMPKPARVTAAAHGDLPFVEWRKVRLRERWQPLEPPLFCRRASPRE